MFEPASKSMPAIDYVSMVRAVYGDRRAMLLDGSNMNTRVS